MATLIFITAKKTVTVIIILVVAANVLSPKTELHSNVMEYFKENNIYGKKGTYGFGSSRPQRSVMTSSFTTPLHAKGKLDTMPFGDLKIASMEVEDLEDIRDEVNHLRIDKINETIDFGALLAISSQNAINFETQENSTLERIDNGIKATDEEDCAQYRRGIWRDSLSKRSRELLVELQVPSIALISSCQEEEELLRTLETSGIPVCVFGSLESMKTSVMEEPDRSHCFRRRKWTVVLVGSALWSARVIKSAKKEGLYDSKVHWMVIVMGNSSVLETLPHFELYHRITWLKWTPRTKDWAVLVSEATSEGLIAREGARWKRRLGHSQESELEALRPLKPQPTENFFGKLLRVVSRGETYPDVVKSTTSRCYFKKDGSTRCTGYVGETFTIIAESLNLTLINKKVPNCGIPSDNSSRVVIIARDEADLSLGVCSITSARYQIADFSEFFIGVRSSIRSAEPKVINDAFLIFSVFTWKAWLTIPLCIASTVFVLWTIEQITIGFIRHPYKLSFGSIFVLLCKSFVYQGHDRQPYNISGRCLVAVSWLVTITLVGVYAGNLTAWLSIPRLEKPIDSLADLAKRSDLDTYVAINSENHQLFMNQTKGILGAISKSVIPYEGSNFVMKMRRVMRGEAVSISIDTFHYTIATLLNRMEGIRGFAPCRLHISKEPVIQTYFAFIINKNSWFKEQMDRKIRWLRSYGIVTQLMKRFNPPGCYLYDPKELLGSSQSLSLVQLQGVLWVWLTGILVSAVVFLFELVLALSSEQRE